MTNPDHRSLYVLVSSLLATAISLPAVWYFTAAAYASGSLPKDAIFAAALNLRRRAHCSFCSIRASALRYRRNILLSVLSLIVQQPHVRLDGVYCGLFCFRSI